MIAKKWGRGTAIAVVAALALASALGLRLVRGDADETTVYAFFTDASPLIVGNDIKMHGVKVGVVDSIEVERGQAKVGLRVEPGARPLHVDAKATIRPVGLLGERYIDLDRGTASAATIPTGGKLTVERTAAATDLDQVLNSLDDPASAGLAALVTTLGEGLRGTGVNADQAIKALRPAMQDTDQLAELLNDQSSMLTQLVDSLKPVGQALAADKGQSLDTLVGSADKLLSATAANQTEMNASLEELPGTLKDTRRTLRLLTAAAKATTPNLKAMRPTTDQLVALSKELSAFAGAADPALQGLKPVLAEGQALIENAQPIAEMLRQAGPDLAGTAHGARPVVTKLMGNMRNVLDFVKYWALTTNGQDGLSHYFRAHLVITDEIVTGLLPGSKSNTGKKPGKTGLPLLDGLTGSLDALTGSLGLGSLLSGLGNSGRSTTAQRGSATGLTQQQERNLLTSLIGGN